MQAIVVTIMGVDKVSSKGIIIVTTEYSSWSIARIDIRRDILIPM